MSDQTEPETIENNAFAGVQEILRKIAPDMNVKIEMSYSPPSERRHARNRQDRNDWTRLGYDVVVGTLVIGIIVYAAVTALSDDRTTADVGKSLLAVLAPALVGYLAGRRFPTG